MSLDALPEVERRLIDLEIKASFTEDLVDELNKLLVQQQNQIEMLMKAVQTLRQQGPMEGTGGQRNLRDELPPHY